MCVGVSRSVRFFLPTSGGFTHIVCFFFFSPSLSIAYHKAKEFFLFFLSSAHHKWFAQQARGRAKCEIIF